MISSILFFLASLSSSSFFNFSRSSASRFSASSLVFLSISSFSIFKRSSSSSCLFFSESASSMAFWILSSNVPPLPLASFSLNLLLQWPSGSSLPQLFWHLQPSYQLPPSFFFLPLPPSLSFPPQYVQALTVFASPALPLFLSSPSFPSSLKQSLTCFLPHY